MPRDWVAVLDCLEEGGGCVGEGFVGRERVGESGDGRGWGLRGGRREERDAVLGGGVDRVL